MDYSKTARQRAEQIKKEYDGLRENGLTGGEARDKLANLYLRSAKCIEYYLYGKWGLDED